VRGGEAGFGGASASAVLSSARARRRERARPTPSSVGGPDLLELRARLAREVSRHSQQRDTFIEKDRQRSILTH
jgi:hypothetical protein